MKINVSILKTFLHICIELNDLEIHNMTLRVHSLQKWYLGPQKPLDFERNLPQEGVTYEWIVFTNERDEGKTEIKVRAKF